MNHADQYAKGIKDVFTKRRETLIRELNKIDKICYQAPQGTFYALIDISKTRKDSKSFCFELLEKEHVAVIPGIAFGNGFDNYVRLAFTLDEAKIIEGVKRINRYIKILWKKMYLSF